MLSFLIELLVQAVIEIVGEALFSAIGSTWSVRGKTKRLL